MLSSDYRSYVSRLNNKYWINVPVILRKLFQLYAEQWIAYHDYSYSSEFHNVGSQKWRMTKLWLNVAVAYKAMLNTELYLIGNTSKLIICIFWLFSQRNIFPISNFTGKIWIEQNFTFHKSKRFIKNFIGKIWVEQNFTFHRSKRFIKNVIL